MKVKMITPGTRRYFKHLLNPETYRLMDRGEPLIAIGLLDRNIPVGAVAGMLDKHDLFTVMSLYVAETHRRKGGGSMLLHALRSLLEETGSGTAVLSYVEDPDDGSADKDFFRFMESLEIRETASLEHLYEVPLGSFFMAPFFSGDFKSGTIRPLSDLAANEKEAFFRQYEASNGEWMGEWYTAVTPDPDLSFVRIKDHTVSGGLLFGKGGPSGMKPVMSVSRDSDPKAVGMLLSTFVCAGRNELSPDIKILLPVPDDRYVSFFEQLHDVRDLQHNYIF